MKRRDVVTKVPLGIAGALAGGNLIKQLLNTGKVQASGSINYQALLNWDSQVTSGYLTTATNAVDAFNNAWAPTVNNINTAGYQLTSSDLTSLNAASGAKSLSVVLAALEASPSFLQMASNLSIDNCAVGQSGSTPFPASPDPSDTVGVFGTGGILAGYGINPPANPSWPHFGNGWADYQSQTPATFEGIGWSTAINGGIPTSGPAGTGAAYSILQGPSTSSWPWTILPGAAQQLAVGSASQRWVLSSIAATGGFQLFKWNTSTNNWDLKPGALTQISVGSDGEVWGINNVNNSGGGGRNVYRWNGTAFYEPYTSYGMEQIYVANASNIYAVDGLGYVYKWSGHDWTHLVGITSPTKVSVANDGTINAIYNQTIYQWTGSTWESFGGAQSTVLDDIFAVSSTVMYQYTSNGTNQYLYKHSGGTWTQIPLAPNAGNSSGAIQYVGKDGSLWSYISDPSAMSPNFDNIYQYVGGVWQASSGGWIIKVLVIASDATKLALLSGIFPIGTFFKAVFGIFKISCGTWPCRVLAVAASGIAIQTIREIKIVFDVNHDIVTLGIDALQALALAKKVASLWVIITVFSANLMYACGCSWGTIWGK